jgi:methyl-accepting chemotaxis protein
MTERLAGVDQLTEQTFLQVGGQVQEGRRRSVALAELAERALQPDEHETAEQMVDRLQLLTERSALWLTEARDQSQMIRTILHALERDVDTLSAPLRELAKLVKTLQALRVATRIEAARSHAQGAQVLGLELYHLGRLMEEKLAQIVERCEVLATLRRRATAMEEQAQAGPLRAADNEIRQARLLLGRVASRCFLAAEHTVRLQQRSTEPAENFGELVAALQFQDITRQRLQHICGALDELRTALLAEGEVKPAVGNICRLQHDQLTWAVGEFCDAVERLERNLQGMTDGVGSLAADARKALVAGSNEQSALIAPSLQAVTRCLEEVQTAHLAAAQAVFAVCQAVRDVAALTGEIEQLGEEMQLLAQNAAVSAAHGSERTAGLTVIAGNIQALAEEAGRHAVAMADGCRRVSVQAEALDARDQPCDNREADLGGLLEEARTLIERLDAGSQLLDAKIAAIGRLVAELGDDMQTTLAGLDIRRQFLAQATPVLEELHALAGEHGAAAPEGDDRCMLLNLRDRYTMMSEREVHQRFLQRAEGAQPMAELSAHGFGSNVELF